MNDIKLQAQQAITELVSKASLKKGDLVVIGCSSSEIAGGIIGRNSSVECAKDVFDAVHPILKQKGIFLAAQCCEHLNRALIVEKAYAAAYRLETVNVVPFPKAGGSWATVCYENFDCAAAVEHIKADAGIDIGDTFIGMHLKEVAVPLRLSVKKIGGANVTAARTRAKFIGGERAHYDSSMM